MKLKLKLFVPVVLFTLVSVGVTSFIVLSAVNKKEGLQSESLALSEVGALSQSLRLYSLEIKKALLHTHLSQNVMEYGPFLAVAKIDNSDLTYKVSKFSSRTSKIKESVFKKKIQDIPLAMAGVKNQLTFYMMPYAQKSPYLLAFLTSKNSILVGFLKPHDLSSLFDSRQSLKHQIYVLANKVYAVAHPDKKYLGVNMDNHPLSRLALSSKHQSGVRTHQTESGQKDILSFDNVEGTNLTVGVNHNLAGGWILPYIQPAETLLALLLLIIVGWGLFRIMQRPLERTLGQIKSCLQKVLRGEPFESSIYFAKESPEFVSILEALKESLDAQPSDQKVSPQNEGETFAKMSVLDKNDIFRNLSLNISSLFQRPLGTLLGHLQMAKVESDKSLIYEKIDFAQRDVRKLRAKLDELIHAVSDKNPSMKPLLLMDCLNDLIREKIEVFNQKGIKITKNLNIKKYVRSQQVTLEKALSIVIDFFISAFAEQIQREIQFDLIDGRNELVFQITCNCTEFKVEDVKKLLDPFHQQILDFGDNLSLAIASTIIENIEGVIKIEELSEYENQRGLVFKIFLPLATENEIENHFSSIQQPMDSLEEPTREEPTREELINKDLDNVLARTSSDGLMDEESKGVELGSSSGAEATLMQDSFSGFHYEEGFVDNQLSQVSEESGLIEKGFEKQLDKEEFKEEYKKNWPHEDRAQELKAESTAREDDEDTDDFVMLRPPRASDIPPPYMEVTDPFQSVTLKKLKDQNPIHDEEVTFPDTPVSSSLSSLKTTKVNIDPATQSLSVKIRKPKVRGGH